jgi:hypothetical protein
MDTASLTGRQLVASDLWFVVGVWNDEHIEVIYFIAR